MDLTANPLEIIAIVLAAVIPVCVTYLLNCQFQRKFALTEKLWNEKYKGLKAVQRELDIIYDVACSLKLMVESINDETISNAYRHSCFSSYASNIKHAAGLDLGEPYDLSSYKPDEFDKVTANIAYLKIIIPWTKIITDKIDIINGYFSGLSLILHDTSLHPLVMDIMERFYNFLKSSRQFDSGCEDKLKDIFISVKEFNMKATKELYLTRKSKLSDQS